MLSKALKRDIALVASSQPNLMCHKSILAAIERLQSLPGPDRWPPMACKINASEFEEFRTIGRQALKGSLPSVEKLRRFQIYAELIFEVIDRQAKEETPCAASR